MKKYLVSNRLLAYKRFLHLQLICMDVQNYFFFTKLLYVTVAYEFVSHCLLYFICLRYNKNNAYLKDLFCQYFGY